MLDSCVRDHCDPDCLNIHRKKEGVTKAPPCSGSPPRLLSAVALMTFSVSTHILWPTLCLTLSGKVKIYTHFTLCGLNCRSKFSAVSDSWLNHRKKMFNMTTPFQSFHCEKRNQKLLIKVLDWKWIVPWTKQSRLSAAGSSFTNFPSERSCLNNCSDSSRSFFTILFFEVNQVTPGFVKSGRDLKWLLSMYKRRSVQVEFLSLYQNFKSLSF